MDNLLINIINKQKIEFEHFNKKVLIPRLQTVVLEKALESSLIKVILGPRRAGKSTLVLQALQNKKFSYFNFEDENIPSNINTDELLEALNEVYGDCDFYYFDEIQLLNRWEQFLNKLHRLGKNIIITGSNAQLLSDEFSSSLTGRHIAIEVLPLSLREIFLNKTFTTLDIEKYLLSGGFPEIALKNYDFLQYLSTLWDSVILRDIAKRKKIRNLISLNDLLSVFLSSISCKFNTDSLVKQLDGNISAPTAKNFISYGEQAYLITSLQEFSTKHKLRIKSDRKAYVVDTGFYNAKYPKNSPNYGALFENLVFNELRMQGYKPNFNLFYYTTKTGLEVDFILRSGHTNIEAIQVCYKLGSLKTKEREFRSLIQASKELNINKLTVITFDETAIENYKKQQINIISFKDWILLKSRE